MIPRCCQGPITKRVIYDCGPDPDQELELCEYHYNLNPAFQRNIKKIEDVKE